MSAEGKRESVFHRLYVGTGAFDIVGKRKRWYVFFAALCLFCLLSVVFRNFNYGIDFIGGTQIQLPAVGTSGPISTDQVGKIYQQTFGKEPEQTQLVGTGQSATVQLRSATLDANDTAKLKTALFDELHPEGVDGKSTPDVISDSAVSASWGGDISQQALIALALFLVLVTLFLAFYFERSMALAALVSLVNDLLVTAGVYSLIGFEVTPATVIGFLTILGFSLYDTVVVFDKVRENTKGILTSNKHTYAEAANLAVNQTLMRSINTSLIALLPVLGLLAVGVILLGVGTLQDLALIQLTGMLIGSFSSIGLATPLLVDLKMRDSRFRAQAARVRARRASAANKASADDDVESGAVSDQDVETTSTVEPSTPKRRPTGKRRSSIR